MSRSRVGINPSRPYRLQLRSILAAKGNAEDDNAEDDYDKDDDADDIDEIHDIKKDSILKVGFPPGTLSKNLVSRPDKNWAKNITSRVFTCFHYIHTCIEKNAPPICGHVFSPIWIIFKLV
ncbi:hypothetical protein DPMN_018963 [Dreissena polymorpha]|uniref:Uncharacterized protein n=1 Tax=Dreissena polymorpha TaxID=45954 RepID=A0A9D4NJG6_DREPO|nr:hypothetical protein DPMN_018963 [Dreissena polymorpha]